MSEVFCALLGQCKVVHFLRHAEAESNVAAYCFPRGSAEYNAAYADPKFFDAQLSPRGVEQCRELCQRLRSSQCDALSTRYEIVLCSPLRRALATATQVFGDRSVPWIALETIREYSSGHSRPCDRRRSKDQQQQDFPFVDFSGLADGEDKFPIIETEEALDARCKQLLQFLHQRPESCLAVVSHTGFLQHLFWKHLNQSPDARSAAFANCELRSVMLAFPKVESTASTSEDLSA
jgi:broad specificity phosphatase PhoE